MDDLISRQAAIEAIEDDNRNGHYSCFASYSDAQKFKQIVNELPSVHPEIIRCKDCRWWDKFDDYDNGYCMAAKHGYLSEHWDISIRRTYKGDFYCADAEPKGGQE